MKKITQSVIPAILWLIISTVLLTLPGTRFPKEDWFDKIGFDKWIHIIMFGLLTWLWCMGLKQKTKKRFYIIALLCLLYGISMEFVQRYCIPFRSFDPGDIVADAIGCLSGLIFSIKRYIKK
ncbi:MAG TPA: VanZ family protein [Chitinophagaceae bacterium]|nr:VanZ family protein [Chitinophagaceae bacterium]MCB9055370.1 VanZ family protein [Chitinophagales bacterium]HPG11902.1 VanZ family protein [Chitinophagaceae bacterium]HRX94457.1 VanZ family protein [Chitinophagaceae bacterium]